MQCVYNFTQCELDSMTVIKFGFPVYKLVKEFNNNESLLRLFGRFYEPLYGVDGAMIKDTITFSTFQTLVHREPYLLEDLNDTTIEELAPVLKQFLESQSVDFLNPSNWPPMFLSRLKAIYAGRSQSFDLDSI